MVRRLPARVLVQLLVEDALADVDATVANVDARAGDELAHLGVALPQKEHIVRLEARAI